MSVPASSIEMLLRRDKAITAGGLIAIVLLAWLYVLTGAGTGMTPATMTSLRLFNRMASDMGANSWSTSYWAIMLIMWWVMMIAMMLPSAVPVVLLYGRVCRQGGQAETVIPTASFLLGYLLAWLAFSVVATAVQAALEGTGLLDPMMMWSTDWPLTVAFLLAAGLYQLSPVKTVCLDRCRAPVDFLVRNWRPHATGALRMGLQHGLFCVGCCWPLMALLFAGGVMNLIWLAGLSVLVLAEKLAPFGRAIGTAAGLALILAAASVLLSAVAAGPS